MKTPIRILTVAALALGLSSANAATIIDAGNFVSTGSNQYLNGTTTGITVNTPGGNWVWGAGWDWSGPVVNATWNGFPQNAANLGEEKTAVTLTMGTSNQSTILNLSADICLYGVLANVTGGLGFWSSQPVQSNAGNSITNFTGITFDETGSMKLYSAGTYTGSSRALGALSESVFYNLSYSVNTSTGAISNIVFNGSGVSAFSETPFTNAATGYVGIMSGNGSRIAFDNLVVADAVPEPSTWALLLGGGLFVAYLRRTRQSLPKK